MDNGIRFVSLRNNGLLDIIQKNAWGASGAWINTGSSWQADSNYMPPSWIIRPFDGKQIDNGMRFIDLNGNGLTDIVLNNPWEADAWMNSGSGWQENKNFTPPIWIMRPQSGGGGDMDNGVRFLDLNGNGLTDMVHYGAWGGPTVWMNTKTDWHEDDNYNIPTWIMRPFEGHQIDNGLRFLDLNGNGRPDIVVSNPWNKDAWINTGSGWQENKDYAPTEWIMRPQSGGGGDMDNGVRFLDLTGDGLSDMVQYGAWEGPISWINTGTGWQKNDDYDLPTWIMRPFKGKQINNGLRFIDLNGSGLPDMVVSNPWNKDAWINTDQGWKEDKNYAPPVWITRPWSGGVGDEDNGVKFVDLNGNGIKDLLVSGEYEKADAYLNKAKKRPDMLIGITDGLGEKTSVDYEPLSGTYVNVYSKDNDAKYPNMDFDGPTYVVYQTASSNPINDPVTLNKLAQPGLGDTFNPPQSPYSTIPQDGSNQHITTYHYIGAKFNNFGFGFLGFRQVKTTDNSTGISKIKTYSQNTTDHTQGNMLAAQTQTKDGTIISSTAITWATKTFGSGAVNQTYYALSPKQIVKNNFSLTGKPISIKTITTTTNDYGDPTEVISSIQNSNTGASYTTDTKNSYQEDPNNWILGDVTDTTVTKSAPNVPSTTRNSHFEYDANSMLTKTVLEPDDPTYTLTKTVKRDQFGNIIFTTTSGRDIQARTSSITYDPNGRYVIQKTNALGQSVYQTVDPKFGEPTQTTDLNGLITRYQYDGFGRLLQTTHPNNTIDAVDYQWTQGVGPISGAVYTKTTISTDSPSVTIYYDPLNRQIAKSTQGFDGKTIWQKTQYDELSRVTQKSLPFYEGDPEYDSRIDYDALGRVIKTTKPDGSTVQVQYNGLSTTTTNPLGQQVTKIINVQNKLVKAIDNLGNETNYQYDAYGNLTKTIDSAGNVSTITYDKLGRKISINDPDKGKWTYVYDQLGQLLSQTDAAGATTSFKYDLLNRMIARTDPAGTSTWAYGTDPAQHNMGLLSQVNGVANISKTSPNQITIKPATGIQLIKAAKDGLQNYSRTIEYNSLSLPETDAVTINGQTYYTRTTYDQDSRPETVTYANGVTIKNEYNALGYLTTVLNEGSGQTYYQVNAMDAQGHVTAFTRSNGLVTTKTYDPKTGFLTDIETNPSQALKIQQKLFGKPNGISHSAVSVPRRGQARLARRAPARIVGSSRDLTVNQQAATVQSLHYQYDPLGNVQSRNNDATNTQESFTYDNLDRITGWQQTGASTQARTYQYDNLGNLTKKSNVGYYSYDKQNAGPHAVTQIKDSTGKTITTFQYGSSPKCAVNSYFPKSPMP